MFSVAKNEIRWHAEICKILYERFTLNSTAPVGDVRAMTLALYSPRP